MEYIEGWYLGSSNNESMVIIQDNDLMYKNKS